MKPELESARLTPCEQDVLALIVRGFSTNFRKFQRKAMRSQLSKIRASMQEMAGCRHVVAPVPAWPSPVEQSPKTGRDSKRPGWARKRDRRRKERL